MIHVHATRLQCREISLVVFGKQNKILLPDGRKLLYLILCSVWDDQSIATIHSLPGWTAQLADHRIQVKTVKAYLCCVRSSHADMGFEEIAWKAANEDWKAYRSMMGVHEV